MVKLIPYYAMFTDEGNCLVSAMVEASIDMKRDWAYVYKNLELIADAPGFEEALDTDVREHVFEKLVDAGLEIGNDIPELSATTEA